MMGTALDHVVMFLGLARVDATAPTMHASMSEASPVTSP
jgi:hypothetical protein